MEVIRIEKRSDDYMAYFDGNRGQWDCSPSMSSAIGNLLFTWGKEHGILVLQDDGFDIVVKDYSGSLPLLVENHVTLWTDSEWKTHFFFSYLTEVSENDNGVFYHLHRTGHTLLYDPKEKTLKVIEA